MMMENLERTWFRCRTCGIERSNEVKAQYESPYDDKLYTWDECTTCALECTECGEPVERDNAATIGHSKHWFCWAIHCSKQNDWVEECTNCDECPICDHCVNCQQCLFECTCYTP